MPSINSMDIELLGRVVTFDVVTFYGLICAAIFSVGLIAASKYEQRRAMQDASQSR